MAVHSLPVAGSSHKLQSGETVPLSLVNNTAPDFSIPSAYQACDFPFATSPGYHPAVCHLLALSMKLVYEKPEVIKVLPPSLHTMLSRACAPKHPAMQATEKVRT